MIRNFVLENANPPGTNSQVQLAGAVSGRVTWRSAYADGAPVFYFIDDGAQAEWGVGVMHWGSPNTISRDTVVGNTATDQNNPALPRNRLNFTSAVQVYSEIPAERMPFINQNVLSAPGAYLDPHAGGFPIGGACDFYGAVAPVGWVWANGQALSRSAYPYLFAVFSTIHGAPDPNTFNVPNRCEQFSVGRATMGGAALTGRMPLTNNAVLGAAVGDYRLPTHTHTLNWYDPGHAHSVQDPAHNHSYAQPVLFPVPGQGVVAAGTDITLAFLGSLFVAANLTGIQVLGSSTGITSAPGASGPPTIANSGAGAGQNVPPALVCNVIIFAGPVP